VHDTALPAGPSHSDTLIPHCDRVGDLLLHLLLPFLAKSSSSDAAALRESRADLASVLAPHATVLRRRLAPDLSRLIVVVVVVVAFLSPLADAGFTLVAVFCAPFLP